MLKTHKGQLSTMDALAGLAGLTVILLLSFTLFSTLYGGISSSQERYRMEAKAFYASEELLGTGSPPNWQYLPLAQVDNFGLASQPGVLDESKILALNSTLQANYTLVQERLGLAAYNFSIEISDYYNSSVIYMLGDTNRSWDLRLQRLSTLNNSLVRIRLMVAG